MAVDKFVKSFLILVFLRCVVRNGFCAPIEDEVVLNDGTVLKRVIHDVVKAPEPRYANALDADKKAENELAVVIQEAQYAPPPHIISKRDADDDDFGDDDSKASETKFLSTTHNEIDVAQVKASTPGVAGNVAQLTTVLGMQKQNLNENKNEMISTSPKSENQEKPADEDEDEDTKEQESTLPAALPTRLIKEEDGGKAVGSEGGSINQGDTRNDADSKQNTNRNDVDDQSKRTDKPSEKNDDNEQSDNNVDNKRPGENTDDKPSDENIGNKAPGENDDDLTTSDENNEDLADTADEKSKMNTDGDGEFGDDEDEDEDENSNHLSADENRTFNVNEEEDEGEEVADDDDPRELDRSGLPKKDVVSESQSSGHFMSYFLIAVVFVACFYLVFHNRQKIKAYVLEGKNGRGRRRKAGDSDYRQLSTAEDVLPSADKGMESKTTYAY